LSNKNISFPGRCKPQQKKTTFIADVNAAVFVAIYIFCCVLISNTEIRKTQPPATTKINERSLVLFWYNIFALYTYI